MAVYFNTSDAAGLLKKFDGAIKQKEAKGKITTWIISADGKFYTHAADAWTKKAWFTPTVEKSRLRFNIIKPKSANVSLVVFGYYHGHLIETFLNHFAADFTLAEATAGSTSNDNCSS